MNESTPNTPSAPAGDTNTNTDTTELEQRIVEQIKTVFDPEIPVNVYELGLIYGVDIKDGVVNVQMTLTSPACPVAGILPLQVETKVKSVEGVDSCKVHLVWDPTWAPSMMTEAAQLKLNLDDAAPSHLELAKRMYDINIESGKS